MAITNQDIHAAADRIASEGGNPTLANVRAALGGGSFTTISEAMKAWKDSKKSAGVPMREAAPAAVAERLSEVGGEIWAIALGMANDRLASEREALEQTRVDMEQSQAEAAELADQLAAELDVTKATVAKQTEAIALTEMVSAKQAIKIEGMTKRIAEAEDAAHSSGAALAELRVRVDELSSTLDKERSARAAADQAKAVAEQQAAAIAAKLEAADRRAGESDAREKLVQERAVEAEKLAASLTAKLEAAERRAGESDARENAAQAKAEEADKAAREAREAAAELRGKIEALTANTPSPNHRTDRKSVV